MAPPLPPPGQLIVENLILLSGSSTAFSNRYGQHISPTTFSKPGNSPAAYAVLHFLICIIDGDIAHTQFKPCFPILDREQERDFRKVVDTRLSLLEKNKLLPQGSARKSVIAAAGGDRFVDLLWSLSALAVQQACVRQPPYASASRLRLESPVPPPPPSVQSCGRADSTLSHQSSARSSRSLMSVNFRGHGGGANAAHDHRGRDMSKQRRFLSAGMVSAAQQRAREADSVRSRIHAERTTLARTAELGKVGEKTWASEAESLRERIGEFEAKVRRLKGQLADMGFDEMGNDIRGKEREGLRKSCSREEFSDELKTSPIESMESGSSVDELLEPGDGCEDIAQDLSRILAFAAETKEAREEVERVFPGDSPVVVMDDGQKVGLKVKEGGAPGGKPKDMVQLVRAAADELEQATRRMDEIQEARKKAEETEALLNTCEDGGEGVGKPLGVFDPAVGKAMLESALLEHKGLIDSSQNLAKVASKLTENSRDDVKKIPLSESDDSLQTIDPVATIPKPTWLNEATADASESKLIYANHPAISDGSKCSSDEVDTSRDVQHMSKALFSSTPPRQVPRPSSSANSRRVKVSASKPPERQHTRHVRSNSASISPRSRLDSLHGTPSSYLSAKTARSVRFAALPPSYSANRSVGFQREDAHLRARRQTPDVFPRNHDVAATEEDERSDTEASDAGSVRDDRSDTGRRQSNTRRVERRDGYSRKDLAPRRVVDEKCENQPRTTRVQRTETPRRVVRRKEAIQRSVLKAAAVTPAKALQGRSLHKPREPTHSVHIAEPRGDTAVLQAMSIMTRAGIETKTCSSENKAPPGAGEILHDHTHADSLDIENDRTIGMVKEEELLPSAASDVIFPETEADILADEKPLFITNEILENEVRSPGSNQAAAQASHREDETETSCNLPVSCDEEQSSFQVSESQSDNPGISAEAVAVSTPIPPTAEDVAKVPNLHVRSDDIVDLSNDSVDEDSGKDTGAEVHIIVSDDCKKTGERDDGMQAPAPVTIGAVVSGTDRTPPSPRTDLIDVHVSPRAEQVDSVAKGTNLAVSAAREHHEDTATDRLSPGKEPAVAIESGYELKSVDPGTSPTQGNVQKKLFMTPQPIKGHGRDRPRSANPSRRSLAWKAAGSLLGNKYPSKGNVANSARKDARKSGYLPPLRGDSPAGSHKEDRELTPSPASKTEHEVIAGQAEVPQGGKGEGFFAGQTAQWQSSVQSQKAATGRHVSSSSRLSSNNGVLDSSTGQSRDSSTSSARRSRMKSLKARLAAALK